MSNDNQYQNASDIFAKELLNTHGLGEPSADNIKDRADSQAANS